MTDPLALVGELMRSVAIQDGGPSLAWRLCRAFQTLTGADGVALTMSYTSPSRVTLATTSQIAAEVEDLQDVIGEGPGACAEASGAAVYAALGAATPMSASQWPLLDEAVRAGQWRLIEVLALPVGSDGAVAGVLTCYITQGQPLSMSAAECRVLADVIGATVLSDWSSSGERIEGAWATRTLVHQATGTVMAQLGVGPDDALVVLRARAFVSQLSLEQVAASVLKGGESFIGDN